MFREFAANIISLAFFATVCEMITPNGSLNKYFKLFVGFMMMLILLKPFTSISDLKSFDFSFEPEVSNEEIIAKSDAYILQAHKNNIEAYILEKIEGEGKVFVELHSDGQVKSVVIRGAEVENSVLDTIKEEIGCDNIEVLGDYIDE